MTRYALLLSALALFAGACSADVRVDPLPPDPLSTFEEMLVDADIDGFVDSDIERSFPVSYANYSSVGCYAFTCVGCMRWEIEDEIGFDGAFPASLEQLLAYVDDYREDVGTDGIVALGDWWNDGWGIQVPRALRYGGAIELRLTDGDSAFTGDSSSWADDTLFLACD